MLPLLRLLGIISPVMLFASFCLVGPSWADRCRIALCKICWCFCPKAELEWIATMLRQALGAEAALPATNVVPNHAIQADQTRIST